MKKLSKFAIILAVAVFAETSGCKPSDTTNAIADLPNVASFLLQSASAFVAGAVSTISLNAPNLGSGTFTVGYTLSGANNFSGTATLTMSGSTGTFQTGVLPNSGETNISITSISNSAGGSASVTSGNTYSISDSTGLMTGTYTSGGAVKSFRMTHVVALATGSQLVIDADMYEPTFTVVSLTDYLYAGSTQSVYFNENQNTPPSISTNSTYNGVADYNSGSSTGGIADIAAHGNITITATSPLLTGTFTYTNEDSSVVTGTFSCPHP